MTKLPYQMNVQIYSVLQPIFSEYQGTVKILNK